MIYIKDININPQVTKLFIDALEYVEPKNKDAEKFIEQDVAFILFAEISTEIWNKNQLHFNWTNQ